MYSKQWKIGIAFAHEDFKNKGVEQKARLSRLLVVTLIVRSSGNTQERTNKGWV